MKKILQISSFCLLSSCVSYFGDFSKAQRFLKKGKCLQAYEAFSLLAWDEKKKKFLFKAIKTCEKKDLKTALLFYKKILTHSQDAKEKIQIQKKLAYFSLKLKDHRQALSYYEALLLTAKTKKEKFDIKYKMSISFFALEKYEQALVEINKALEIKPLLIDKKEALLLKGRIFIAKGDFKKAVSFLKNKIKEFPKLANFLRGYLALIFEEKGKIKLSIDELEKVHPQTSFSQNKINRLYERLKNQPGGSP